MAEYTIDKFTYDGNTYKLKSSVLKNLVDGSQTGSVRGINTATEDSNYTIGLYAVTEGSNTRASGQSAHAEGSGTKASNVYAHAEGGGTTASGAQSHSEGGGTTASGANSHSEGGGTIADGAQSHAEGGSSQASGDFSHAEGLYTIANHLVQHVFGEYNVADSSTAAATERGNYIEIVGNGTSSTRSNARTLDWSGNEVLAGKLTLGTAGVNSMDAVTMGQVDAAFDSLSTVASSGSYNDLTNKPSIPVVDSQLSTVSTNAIQNKAVTEAWFTNAKNTWYGVGSFANDVLTVATTQHTQYTTAFQAALGHTVRVLMASDAEFTSTSTANVDGTGAYTIFNGEDGVVTAGDLITLTFENRYEQGNMYVVSYVSKKSGVTAGTYVPSRPSKSYTYFPSITVDNTGHITSASNMGYSLDCVGSTDETPKLITQFAYNRTVRSYLDSSVISTYILAAGNTSKTISISNIYGGGDSYFKVDDVICRDRTTYEPIICDWKTTTFSAYDNHGSLSLAVSIAEPYTNDILIDPIISYGISYGM